jgi:PAS domain S-box-containing protein
MEKRYFRASGSIVWVNLSVSLVRDANRNPLYFVSQVEDITEWKRIEAENERARHLLSERVKELMTLARVSQILHEEGKPIEQILQEITNALPEGWQYPEITAARITVGAVQFVSQQFQTFHQVQAARFPCPDQHEGLIEVFYLEQKPQEQEGPFLKEERDLIDLVAERLRAYFAHQYEAERVRTSEANLHATINNTNIQVWTVDREFRLLIFNEAFRNFIKFTFQRDVAVGSRAFAGDLPGIDQETKQRWVDRYGRALKGEVFTIEDQRWNRHFRYSLNPVQQNNEIVGVAVFGEDITERVQQEKELLDANQKIGELKLMALRSVMNPHFIFNALNSIQFFIAKNDRQNAINYLSTFSKLVRGILTHSVNNYILLADELEMLRHYINLEMLRFENKFDFVLNVAADVDVDGIEIPSLLIQPYVENAILHGLYNKVERGILQIDVLAEEEAILFVINDDGIGREAAMRLRSEHLPKHKSMGSQLTEERLRLINKQESVHLEIIDKYADRQPIGTCIKIRIRVDR